MKPPSESQALVILFGKFVVSVPYNAKYDYVDEAVFRLIDDPNFPTEARALLERYPYSHVQYFEFTPVTRDFAEQSIANGGLEFLQKGHKKSRGGNPMRRYDRGDDAQTTCLAVEYPPSLRQPNEGTEVSLTQSKEWCDFLADRKLEWFYEMRFMDTGLFFTSDLLVEAPSGLSEHDCPGLSHIVKPLTARECKTHKQLEHCCESKGISWPTSLCKIDASFPEETLPDSRTLVVFPDYGISFSCFVTCYDNPDCYLTYTTLWECVYQLVEAVEFLHAHGVAHLDINPANVALQVEACSNDQHPDPDSWYPKRHMHPRLTLLDLGSAKLDLRPGTDLCWNVAGTPGWVPPEVQAYFDRMFPSEPAATEDKWEIRDWETYLESSLDREPELIKSSGIASSSDSGSQSDQEDKPAPYSPLKADIWAIGNTIKTLSYLVNNSLHVQAMTALGDRLMDERPSAIISDEKEAKMGYQPVSALRRVVKEVEEKLDLNGAGKVPFKVEPMKDNRPTSWYFGPCSPFY